MVDFFHNRVNAEVCKSKSDMEPVPSTSQGPSSNISSATEATIATPSAQPVDPALRPAQLSDVDRVEFVRRGPFKGCVRLHFHC